MTWDPVHDGRAVFLACMRAFCAPGARYELPRTALHIDPPELNGAAAILLALLDRGLSLGHSGGLATQRTVDLVLERTGATRGEPAEADWVLVHGPAADVITRARRGTRLSPDTGATVVVAAAGDAVPVTLAGPGIPGRSTSLIPLDTLALHAFAAANAAPPCGVDLLVVDGDGVIGMPRSIAVVWDGV